MRSFHTSIQVTLVITIMLRTGTQEAMYTAYRAAPHAFSTVRAARGRGRGGRPLPGTALAAAAGRLLSVRSEIEARARASSRLRSRKRPAIAIRVSRTLTTSAVRAAVALRAATRATGATTRRAETVAAIVAGCVCDANVRCGVPTGARLPENATRKPVRASHVFPHLTRPKPRITSDTNVALERRRARKCSD